MPREEIIKNLDGNYPLTVGKDFGKHIDRRCGGIEEHYLCPPKDIGMRLPNRMLCCVGFLAHDTPEIRYQGTGFLVAVKGEHGHAYTHIVTAGHVAEQLEHGSWLFGMNGKTGGKILLRSSPEVGWWYHPSEKDSVDCAVTVFATANYGEYDLEWIPEDMFATDETIDKRDIGIGDEVNIVGLFTRFHGKERHIPIVRSGNVAMMPSEPIPTQSGAMEAYLIESRSIGGLSGSPVFVRETLNAEGQLATRERRTLAGQGALYLFGLMHGHWEVPVKLTPEQVEAVNMGISIVVPAKKIVEVLYHPELVAMRKKYDDEIAKDNLPVKDSATKEKPFTQADFETALKKVTRKVAKDK